MLQTLYREVANLLRTCYGKTGVIDFGLFPSPDCALICFVSCLWLCIRKGASGYSNTCHGALPQ